MIDILSTMVGDTSATEAALAFIILFGGWAIIVTQRKGIIDWGSMLKDADGKTSSARVMGVGCFIIFSWVEIALTVDAMSHQDALDNLLKFSFLYVLVFAGTPIASRMLEIVSQVLMLKSGGTPPKE